VTERAFGLGCGGDGGGKAAGEEGGACYPNDSCNNGLMNGTSVVLTAQGNSVVNFTAWTGDCSGTNPVITVVMDRARNCMATFTQIN
jgi:uncharacterized repeat protein (TIGR02543 family)